mgnify:CR=1 FL=1
MKRVKIDVDSLYVIFSKIPEYRDNRGKKHQLIDIFILTTFGLLCGFTDFENMQYYLKRNEKYFSGLLNLKNGIPSHDTFTKIFREIDPKDFMDCFMSVLDKMYKESGDHIALDGKAIRAARDKINKEHTPYIVSAFDTEKLVSISQIKVKHKSNEIPALFDLIKIINIKEKVVTIDAIGCQTEIASLINQREGYYILTVKNNQKELYESIDELFSTYNSIPYITKDKGHSRIEVRKHSTIQLDNYSREYFRSMGWDNIKVVGRINRYRELIGEEGSQTKTYYISNKNISNEELATYVRNHWRIENNLHYILDERFKEDRCTARADNAMENLSILRKIIYNLMHMVGKQRNKTKNKMFIDVRMELSEIEALIFDALKEIK